MTDNQDRLQKAKHMCAKSSEVVNQMKKGPQPTFSWSMFGQIAKILEIYNKYILQ